MAHFGIKELKFLFLPLGNRAERTHQQPVDDACLETKIRAWDSLLVVGWILDFGGTQRKQIHGCFIV